MRPYSFVFLACETTLPNMPNRRVDAFEFDYQFGQLKTALEPHGADIFALDWKSDLEAFADHDAIVIGTPWNYQDFAPEFLAKLDAIEATGLRLFNSADLVRWNIHKTYLKDMQAAGAKTIPTLWVDTPIAADVQSVFDEFDCEAVIVKRQIGAGAKGQALYRKYEAIPDGLLLDRPAMLQPYLPAIVSEGEYSFIFIDGEFSHALLKTPQSGDYRIQSAYGGREAALHPDTHDIYSARKVLDFIPFDMPLYARIDMVRNEAGELCLMEAEMIEPYLYPVEGPDMGKMYAAALMKRVYA